MNKYIDLHAHLDGSINIKIAKELAKLQNIELPYIDNDKKLLSLLSVSDSCGSLDDFLKCFKYPLSFTQTKEGISKSVQMVLDNMADDGVIYSELRFAPQLHTRKGLTQEEIVKSAIEGLEKASIPSNLILCCMRGSDEEKNIETIELAKKYLSNNKGVVAIDLAGAEAVYPTKEFSKLFSIATNYGIPMTIHAGEAGGVEDIKVAIEAGAKRIGHGVRAYKDKSLMELIKNKGIYLEMCPTSNYYTKAISNMNEYPLIKFLDIGIKVTLNTDDMAILRTTLSNEFKYMRSLLGLTDYQENIILNNSIEAAFASEEIKSKLRNQIL